MGAKAYTTAQKLEAVALGRVLGADAAGKQLGIDPRTITGWMRKAGDAPELAGSPGQWQRLLDLAHARTEAALASGKLTAIQVAIIAGIAQRNVREAPPVAEPPTPAEAWGAAVETALVQAYGDDADLALIAAIEWMDGTEGDAPSIQVVMGYLASLGGLREWRKARDDARHAAMLAQVAANRATAEAATRAMLSEQDRRLVEEAERWLAAQADPSL